MGSHAIALELFGVEVVVDVDSPDLAARVCESLPIARHKSGTGSGHVDYRLTADPDDGEAAKAIERLRAELLEGVAMRAPEHVFIRGSALGMGGRAIVVVDDPGQGRSALIGALVGAGATLYADGLVPIDLAGHVHPDPLRPPSGVEPAGAGMPVPVAVVATLTRRDASSLVLREASSEVGLLAMLGNACGADTRSEFALAGVRAATDQAAVLEGEWDRPEEAAAALIERLARVPRQPEQRTELPPAIQFVTLVLELEGQLAGLAETLEAAGVDAVLRNGDAVRPALAHGFAFSYAALVEVPRTQVPRALGAMEAAGWRPVPHLAERRYFRQGVIVKVQPGSRAARLVRLKREAHEPIAKGRLGLREPAGRVSAGKPSGAPAPEPFDPGGRLRTGWIGDALAFAADGLTRLDALRLRTREQDFRGLPIQYGSGVHVFEAALEGLVDAVLARLPRGENHPRVVDMGTGTGILALSIAKERPDAEVLATDISLRALGWARRNRRRLGVRNVRLARGSLVAPVPRDWRGRVAAIVSNPPMALPAYAVELHGRLSWPIGTATGPGADGLGLVRALARDARGVLAPGGNLHVEMLGHQGPWIANYLEELGYEAEIPEGGSYIHVAARWPGS